LWKRFDEACTLAHKVVEQWLEHIKAEAAAHRAQRLALIEELHAWTAAHQGNTDWKAQARDLHRFADAWRNGGHVGEKQFAELQPLWKTAYAAARSALEQAQADNLAKRQALIAQAEALGAADVLRLDAVRAIQQDWQQLAQAVPLDRKLEQKLWDSFRQPIDAAFQRKDAAREKQAAALSVHDQRVLAASQALQEANASGDAQRIQQAMSALQQAMQAAPVNAPAATTESAAPAAEAQATEAFPPAATPVKKLVAMRGDDRPGMKKDSPTAPGRSNRPGERRESPGGQSGRRDVSGFEQRPPRDGLGWDARQERGPRLGDAAFRAQRDALENAQAALKKLTAQAHGQALTQLLDAWEHRDAGRMPTAAEFGPKVNAATRQAWQQALGVASAATDANALLRLEMAAELPTPAEHLDARRALQLHMLTRRNDPAPSQTWGQDVARVLAGAWDVDNGRRVQQALKALLRRF
jgi:ATP-dependent RNA helicase SUPV3L1/SUV3